MKGADSPDNLSRSEEENLEISLEVKKRSIFNKLKPFKKRKKIREKMFSKN